METEDEKLEPGQEWKNRTLCPDGNCVGVIGTDGRCKECGTHYNNPEDSPQTFTETANFPPEDNGSNMDSGTEWENRRLCPDGNCIGIIGPDGRCKECGKS